MTADREAAEKWAKEQHAPFHIYPTSEWLPHAHLAGQECGEQRAAEKIAELESEIAELRETIQDLTDTIAALGLRISERNAEIASLHEWIRWLNRRIQREEGETGTLVPLVKEEKP